MSLLCNLITRGDEVADVSFPGYNAVWTSVDNNVSSSGLEAACSYETVMST